MSAVSRSDNETEFLGQAMDESSGAGMHSLPHHDIPTTGLPAQR